MIFFRHLQKSMRGLRWYFSVVILLFFLAGALAFFVPSLFVSFDSYLRDLIMSTQDLSGWSLFWFILRNNVHVSLFAFLGGIFFGLVPVFFALSNGAIVGYVLRLVSGEQGWGVLWYLVPHGVFELPAVFLSLALGLRLGVQSVHFFLSLFSGRSIGREGALFSQRMREGTFLFCSLIVPLLFIAAGIETYLIDL